MYEYELIIDNNYSTVKSVSYSSKHNINILIDTLSNMNPQKFIRVKLNKEYIYIRVGDVRQIHMVTAQ